MFCSSKKRQELIFNLFIIFEFGFIKNDYMSVFMSYFKLFELLLTLAGKVNLEGDLYLSKNIPYTIETLAIEFNRDTDQIELALDVLIELEMIELTEENIYRVKNFAKHQNIKVKEKIESKDKNEDINNKEVQAKENFKNEIYYNEDKEFENKLSENEAENAIDDKIGNLEIIHKDINKIYDSLSGQKINNNSQDNISILLEKKKSKKANKINCLDFEEEIKDNVVFYFRDGDEKRLLSEGENVIEAWSF